MLALCRLLASFEFTRAKGTQQTDPVEVLPQVVRTEDARNFDELVFVARAVEQWVAVKDLREEEECGEQLVSPLSDLLTDTRIAQKHFKRASTKIIRETHHGSERAAHAPDCARSDATQCGQLEKVRHSFGTSLGLLLLPRTVKRIVVVRVFDQKFRSCASKKRQRSAHCASKRLATTADVKARPTHLCSTARRRGR